MMNLHRDPSYLYQNTWTYMEKRKEIMCGARVLRGSYAAYEGLARLLRSATSLLRGSYAAIRRYNTRVTRRISLVCTGHTRLLRGSYEAYGVHANFIHVFTQGAAYLGKFANTQVPAYIRIV